jgi:hypothetical protein
MADVAELPACDRHVIETGRFTEEERSLLRRHLPAYRWLVENTSLATNERRIRFLRVILRDAEPRTTHEIAFKKFLGECARLSDRAPASRGTVLGSAPRRASSGGVRSAPIDR